MDAIRTEDLTKKYDLGWRKGRLLALDKLNLRVCEGEVYGLLGPFGSCKTTMGVMLMVEAAKRYAAEAALNPTRARWSLPARRVSTERAGDRWCPRS